MKEYKSISHSQEIIFSDDESILRMTIIKTLSSGETESEIVNARMSATQAKYVKEYIKSLMELSQKYPVE